jgi:NCAIR mutase (PurE)-related protein
MIYITPDNKLHDDADGFALTLSSWPKNAREATQAEIAAITNPAETPEQITARLTASVDKYLNDTAKSYGYDDIRSMVSYKDDPNPKFDQEGTAAKFWRSAVFTYCIEVIAAVQAGTRDIPTEAELIAELPSFADFLA